MTNTIYIVRGSAGEYSARHSWTVASFTKQDDACWWRDHCLMAAEAFFVQTNWHDNYHDRLDELTDQYVGETLPSKEKDYSRIYDAANKRAKRTVGEEFNSYDPNMSINDDVPPCYWVEECIMDPEVP